MRPQLLRYLLAGALVAATGFAPLPLRAQHGSGPAPKPLPVADQPPAVSFAEGIKPDPALAALLREFAEALRTHDGRPFVPRLADNFVVPGYPATDMKAAFVKAMTMIGAPDEIAVTAIEPQPDGTKLIRTGFKFPKRTAKREFTLSADNKLVSTTLITMQRPAAGEPVRSH